MSVCAATKFKLKILSGRLNEGSRATKVVEKESKINKQGNGEISVRGLWVLTKETEKKKHKIMKRKYGTQGENLFWDIL